jgi:AraC family transcriptional regulator
MENTQLDAHCAVMSVAYYDRLVELPRERVSSSIVIAVPGEGGDTVAMCLDAQFFLEKAREALGADAAAQAGELVERCGPADPRIRGVACALRAEFRSRSLPSPLFLESLARVIAIHLARNYCGVKALSAGRVAGSGAGLSAGKLERVQAFIEQHLGETLRIERLAATVHMSPFHFARLFKLAAGLAPHAYVTSRRVERAKELLSNAGLPLVHVAANVGFQTQGHFTEVFRRHAGITPRLFRLMANGRNGAYPRKDPEASRQANA